MFYNYLLNKIINNQLLPLKTKNLRKGHVNILIILTLIIIVHIGMSPVETTTDDLYLTANESFKEIIQKTPTESKFNMRSNNLWINIFYYKEYKNSLKQYFDIKKDKMPKPKYPLISSIIKSIHGKQVLPPINLIEIATFLRKTLSSGITIRTENKKITEQILDKGTSSELVKLINNYNNKLKQYFTVVVKVSHKEKNTKKTYYTDFKGFNTVIKDIKKALISSTTVNSISIYKNQKVLNSLNKKNKLLINDKETKTPLYYLNLKNEKQENILELINKIKNKLAYNYTFVLEGKENSKLLKKILSFKLGNYSSSIKKLIVNKKQNIHFHKLSLYESKVLKHKANSRELVNFNQVPYRIKKAFILVEDDSFYFQAGGIDPIGLLKASFNYLIHGSKKGNASIIEQVYEMYLGSSKKTPIEKVTQILGAIYYSYYTKDRNDYANLYVQSIPGSFWRDHNYGIKGIIKNYMNKDSLKNISNRELAWLTKIALLPNTIGQDYIRFYFIKKKLHSIGIDIFNDKQLKEFLYKSNSNNKRFIRLPKEKKLSDYEVLQKLKRSYKATNMRINIVLKQFLKGNILISPLISKKEYQVALKDEVHFNSPSFLSQYQSYTDQSKKDLYRLSSGLTHANKNNNIIDLQNAGVDIEVTFNEEAQKILESELEHSSYIVYNYRYKPTELKRYGGAAILVKTNNIKTGKIENKIIAIASKHTNSNYFNWAVDGKRHFGSIYKWLALLVYLDNKGTLLDSFYDIPRAIKYPLLDSNGKPIVDKNGRFIHSLYTPDNWRINRDDIYGYFTYRQQNNIYNFIQSKNNTFIKIAEIVGIKKISNLLNELAELKYIKNPRAKFQYRYPVVLGSHELSSILFAQINAIIANKGIFKPLTTINKLIDPNGVAYPIILPEKQMVSREAAEAAFFCGYINTFYGTARRFIKGGIGKTGSSNTDVSFLAMTGRTKEEYIKNKPNHLLNNNLLYLVNIGVNIGIIDEGLFGGVLGALNANKIFKKILEYHYVGKKKTPKYKISGNFIKYFSKKLVFKDSRYPIKINNKVIKIPIMKGSKVTSESFIPESKLYEIRKEYINRKDAEVEEEIVKEIAKDKGIPYNKLKRKKFANKYKEFKRLASLILEEQKLGSSYIDESSHNNKPPKDQIYDYNDTGNFILDTYINDLETKESSNSSNKKTTNN